MDVDGENIVLTIDEEQDFSTFVPIPETDSHAKAVEAAGIVGAGGAGFPTFLKLACEIPEGLFIANGAECEALLAHNVKQMSEHIEQLIRGMNTAWK